MKEVKKKRHNYHSKKFHDHWLIKEKDFINVSTLNPEGPGTILLTGHFWNICVIQCAYLVSPSPRGESCIYTFGIEVCCPEYLLKVSVLYSHLLQLWSGSKLKYINTLPMKSKDLCQFTLTEVPKLPEGKEMTQVSQKTERKIRKCK